MDTEVLEIGKSIFALGNRGDLSGVVRGKININLLLPQHLMIPSAQ